MANAPAAEVEIDVALVHRLLAEQMPDLADLPITPFSAGWDNAVLRLGDKFAVRVPRRTMAADFIRSEQLWLGEVATRVQVPVPAPVRLGVPTEFYPWCWSVVPWFNGETAGSVPTASRARLAVPLAEFVAQLHVPAPAEAPRNPVRGGPLGERSAALTERLSTGLVPRADEAARLWKSVLSVSAWAGPPMWLHGDLHPFNILVTEAPGGTPATVGLSAIIDFGDMTAGDPACDLATAWLTFDQAGREVFRREVNARCDLDTDTWTRARGWALVMTTSLLTHSDDNPPFAALGATALAQLLAD